MTSRAFSTCLPINIRSIPAPGLRTKPGTVKEYSPQLVLVSAGFDAHERDPLASMRLSTAGYAGIVRQLVIAAAATPLALVTEGGYDLAALAECLDAAIAAVEGVDPEPFREASSARGERALEAVRAAQAPFWRAI
jgi:acetoin utilization deacetylase AcuC-like enzyme